MKYLMRQVKLPAAAMMTYYATHHTMVSTTRAYI